MHQELKYSFLVQQQFQQLIKMKHLMNINEKDAIKVTSSIDLNASDALGRTCIHHLVQPFSDGSYTSNIELLRLLHLSGALLIKHDLAGLSPLQYGAINGCQYLCDELIKLINDKTNSTQATIEHIYINDPKYT